MQAISIAQQLMDGKLFVRSHGESKFTDSKVGFVAASCLTHSHACDVQPLILDKDVYSFVDQPHKWKPGEDDSSVNCNVQLFQLKGRVRGEKIVKRLISVMCGRCAER